MDCRNVLPPRMTAFSSAIMSLGLEGNHKKKEEEVIAILKEQFFMEGLDLKY